MYYVTIMGNEYYIQKKFWKQIEDKLITIRDSGDHQKIKGALTVPLDPDEKGNKRGICLNIDGKGFVLNDLKNNTLYAPDYITYIVQEIYLKANGETEYYKSIVRKIKST